MCSEIAVSSPMLCTRWMSPGGAKPLTLDDPEHAPGHVIVDRRDLAGAPDEAHDRERAVRLDVQNVAAVAVRVAESLLGRQDGRTRQVGVELSRDERGDVAPVRVAGDDDAHGVDELTQLRAAVDLEHAGHATTFPPAARERQEAGRRAAGSARRTRSGPVWSAAPRFPRAR